MLDPDWTVAAAEPGYAVPVKPPHDHVVRFYHQPETMSDTVAEFLSEGLLLGQAGLVIAVEEHRDALRFALAARGVEVNHALRSEQLTLLDARAMLSAFMRDGMPDEALFRQHVGGAIEALVATSGDGRARAFGEMVDVLWRDGNARAAIRLEELWNALTDVHPFSLLCAYAMGSFYGEAAHAGFEAVCRQHSRVIAVDSGRQSSEQRVLLEESALLRQRADALEAEVEQRKLLELALRDALADRRRAEDALRRDIAERERVEHELRRAKEEAERANRVKAEFLAVMSHELRTPLNAILGYQQLMSEGIGGAPTQTQRLHLERIRMSAGHLLRLIDDVLSVARLDARSLQYHVEALPLRDVLSDLGEMVAPQVARKGLEYVDTVADHQVVLADREKLQQILLNLVGNAIKFTSPPGTVTVSAQVHPAQPTLLLLQVTDTGIGIPADKLETVFERFVQLDTGTTRESGGAGLGLSISRELALAMGGELTVNSELGAGSTFTLSLRRAGAV